MSRVSYLGLAQGMPQERSERGGGEIGEIRTEKHPQEEGREGMRRSEDAGGQGRRQRGSKGNTWLQRRRSMSCMPAFRVDMVCD